MTLFLRRRSALLLLLCLVPGISAGNLLWSLNGQRNTVYLLGSMHMLPASAYPLPPGMEAAYQDARLLVFETDMDAVMSPVSAAEFMRRGSLPEGETLSARLPPDMWKQVSSRSASLGLPEIIMQRLQPWFAANLLVIQQLQRLGYDRNAGLDLHYWQRAGRDGKRRVWLESIEAQLDIFSGLSNAESEHILGLAMQDMDRLARDPKRLLLQWRDGDLDGMADDLTRMQQGVPGLYRSIHVQRNRAWLPQIEAFLQKDENVLIIFGAMHLVGEDGVLELLRRRGHRPLMRNLHRGWQSEEV